MARQVSKTLGRVVLEYASVRHGDPVPTARRAGNPTRTRAHVWYIVLSYYSGMLPMIEDLVPWKPEPFEKKAAT